MNKEKMLNVFRFMFDAKDRYGNAPLSLDTVKSALEEMGVNQDYLTDDECFCILAALAQYKEMKQEKAEDLLGTVIDLTNSSDSGIEGAYQAMNQKLSELKQQLKELQQHLKEREQKLTELKQERKEREQKLTELKQERKELEAFLKLKRNARDLLDELTDHITHIES